MKPARMGVDIETYSGADLAAAGVRPYCEDPAFTVLLIGYKVDDGPTRIIDLGRGATSATLLPPEPSPLPAGDLDEFRRLLTDPDVIKTAYNAAFERTCLAAFFGCPMPPEQWRCTMVLAASLGLSGSLKQVGAALGLEQQKMTEGRELIPFFCRPGPEGRRRRGADYPEKWELFRRYNVRDVDVETEIRDRLSRFSPSQTEQDAWTLDQKINDRGVAVDRTLVDRAIELDGLYSQRLLREAKRVTGIANPNSTAQFKLWLKMRGLSVGSLDKNALPELLAAAPDGVTHRALELRQELSKTSVKKYEAMRRGLCRDGRLHNLLQFYGAGRTGRWAGRLVQVQNLPQNKIPDLDAARKLVKRGEYDLLEMAYGSPAGVLSQLIRTAFIPSPGRRFIVCDYSAIEARVLAWLAGEEWVLQEFRGEGLIYEATAAMMFHVPKDDIRKGGPRADLRPKGKVATLACGYQGGKGALIAMGALKSGIPEEDLLGIVQRWRSANSRIVQYWRDVENAAVAAVQGAKTKLPHGVAFEREDDWLFVTLPSGRRLAYFKPELRDDPRYGRTQLTYIGTDTAGRYARTPTYGGKLTENITQAAARDCLRDAMTALDAAGYDIVFHIHDEVVLDAPEGQGSLADVQAIMGRPLPWAPGLPLRADGSEMEYYRKE